MKPNYNGNTTNSESYFCLNFPLQKLRNFLDFYNKNLSAPPLFFNHNRGSDRTQRLSSFPEAVLLLQSNCLLLIYSDPSRFMSKDAIIRRAPIKVTVKLFVSIFFRYSGPDYCGIVAW